MVGKPVKIIVIYAMLFSAMKVKALTKILYYGEKQRLLNARKLKMFILIKNVFLIKLEATAKV